MTGMKPANSSREAASNSINDAATIFDQVWFTQWPSHAENIFPIFYDGSTPDQSAFVRTWQAGDPLDPENIPNWLVLEEGWRQPRQDLIAIANGVMIISERLADLLRQFNLGPEPTDENQRPRRTELHPMPLFAHDERTLIRKVLLLQCSAHKECFVPEETTRAEFLGRTWLAQLAGPHGIAVPAQREGGLDFWRDPRLRHTWFCSDRLYQAMKAANIKPLDFLPCRMVEPRTFARRLY